MGWATGQAAGLATPSRRGRAWLSPRWPARPPVASHGLAPRLGGPEPAHRRAALPPGGLGSQLYGPEAVQRQPPGTRRWAVRCLRCSPRRVPAAAGCAVAALAAPRRGQYVGHGDLVAGPATRATAGLRTGSAPAYQQPQPAGMPGARAYRHGGSCWLEPGSGGRPGGRHQAGTPGRGAGGTGRPRTPAPMPAAAGPASWPRPAAGIGRAGVRGTACPPARTPAATPHPVGVPPLRPRACAVHPYRGGGSLVYAAAR